MPFSASAWWTRTPIKLRRISPLLSEIWFDGAYLTAWPKAALIAPLSMFMLGFLEGATHWSYVVFANDRISDQVHAIDFAQMLPLLFIAAICGTFSSQLGMLLVAGFAFGDLLIAGPAFGQGQPLDWKLAYVYAPQLISYFAFFLLAVTPTLTAKAMAASLPRWLQQTKVLCLASRGLLACAVQGLSVYAWTLAAPMVVRVHWKWPGGTPPITITGYTATLNPWLPLVAATAVAVRIGLSLSASSRLDQKVISTARQEMATIDRERSSGPAAAILKTVGGAFLTTVLISGLIDTLTRAVWVFGIIGAIFAARNVLLPKAGAWLWWSGVMSRVPLFLRWFVTILASYGVSRSLLSVSSLSPRVNSVPGAFGAELFCFLLSLTIASLLLPPAISGPASSSISNRARWIGKAGMLVALVIVATQPVYAQICLDPFCCFGASGLLAALAVAALLAVWLGLPLLLAAAELGEGLDAFDGLATIFGNLGELGSSAFEAADAEAYLTAPRLPDVPLQAEGWPDLPGAHAPNFISAEPITLPEGTTLYRVIGPGNSPSGQYWSTELPSDLPTWRSQYAVPPEWNGNGSFVESQVGPGGLNVWQGPASYQGVGFEGKGNQVWVPSGTITPSAPIATPW